MDATRKKTLAVLVGVLAIALGIWWWQHDPLRGLGGRVTVDKTMYYQAAKPFFVQPRRQRTLFIEGTTMDKLLGETKKKYPEKDGWVYKTDGMPSGFSATRETPGEQLPESVSATDDRDGKFELNEIRKMSSSEIQLVTRSQGSDAFILYPGVRINRKKPEGIDPNRFLTGG